MGILLRTGDDIKWFGFFFQSQLRIPFHLLQPSDQLTTIGIQEILKQFEGGILDED